MEHSKGEAMKYEYTWETCPEHDFKEVDSQCDRDVVCSKCGMPGEKDEKTGKVFYPAT
jgi:hypothetical protein